ncbi:MAG: hypothetical protein KGI38_09540 [Thaumarchaeota archaeon]|nr:hypothetical protein [Nitrososphaerota archaeon]
MLRNFGGKQREQRIKEVDVVSILGVNDSGDTVRVVAKFRGQTWNLVSEFAQEKGYEVKKELLSMLFSYGVAEVESVEVEKRRSEMFVLGRKYAAMRFETYQLFSDNKALTMALPSLLAENKRLRERAEGKGLVAAKKEEWDDWSRETIDSFYKKYVFVR